MFRVFAALIVVLLVAGGFAYGASTVSSSTFRLADDMGSKQLVITSSIHGGSTASELGKDSDGSPSKHAVVHRWSINGQEVDVLIRVQIVPRGIFVDMIADATISSLTTTVGNISLTGIGHPSTAKDNVDAQAMVAAGGS